MATMVGNEATGTRRWWLRGIYAANIIGAGLPGLVITVAPAWAAENMFAVPQDPVTFGMLGAIWLGIGALSAVGLRYPRPFVGLLALQVVYKSTWLVAVALPRIIAGERLADVGPFALFFGLVVVCWLVGAPLASLLGGRDGDDR